jgi:hypothetical protein
MMRKGFVLLSFGLTACGGFFMPADTVKNQASYELKCPHDQLQIVPLSGDCDKKLGNTYDCTLGISGCGHDATYIHVPGSNNWIMNASRK